VSPRKRRRKRLGCTVARTTSGKLRLRLRVKLPDGTIRRFSEATLFDDTPENRKVLEKKAAIIGAEIRAGEFRYDKWFSKSAHKVGKPTPSPSALVPPGIVSGLTVVEYYPVWLSRQQPPDVRPSLREAYESHFDNHLLELAGHWSLENVSIGHLLWLRGELRKRKSRSNRSRGSLLSGKTVRNILDGSFRALCRDAHRIDGVEVALDAFEDLDWPKLRWEPTPFTEEERDKILAWYSRRLWRVPGFAKPEAWPAYYAYLYTLFFTGCRPSELSAVRIRSVNLNAGTVRIRESIDDGQVGDVKTQSSDRTVRLTPDNTKLLRDLLPLRPDPDAFFFRDVQGLPIDGGSFYNSFVQAQRALNISPIRDLYSTKDTYISICMSNRVDLSWLSDQTGVSEWTIKKHYGRYMHHPDRDALELEKIRPPTTSVTNSIAAAMSRQEQGIRAGRHTRESGAGRQIGVRASAAWTGAVWTSIGPRRASNRQISRENGGDGWESNPPRTLSALMRF
jgi:integrase